MGERDDDWRLGFHLMPPTGWLNDPNGLCQFDGIYHVFFQSAPSWPEGGERGWGHFISPDLVNWKSLGMAIHPDTPDDKDGAYSGSAIVKDDAMCLLYTGNVKLPGEHDYTHSGRLANEILVTSADGEHLSEKRVVMRNADYPSNCSCHVRDPKVWLEGGSYHMVLGARDISDEGFALLYDSADLLSWTQRGVIRSKGAFGYMWECPDHIALGGREFLGCCPQGLPSERLRWQNVYQSGYFPLDGSLLETESIDEDTFREWDFGFDFYAPQTFVDENGRTILIGWVGLPDIDYANPTKMWMNCLTVPRELSLADGVIRQWPVAEIEHLHGERREVHAGATSIFESGRCDFCCRDGFVEGSTLSLNDDIAVSLRGGILELAFTSDAGCGRTSRKAEVGEVHSLRVLVDTSCIEIYANDGETVMTSRWYPSEVALALGVSGVAGSCWACEMEDIMRHTYER